MNQEKIGKFIAELRKQKKLTQEQLAEKLGITKNAVSKWERGLGLMDLSLLKPLSEILGVSVTEILNGEKIDEEIDLKSEEILIDTLDYSVKEIEKVKKKLAQEKVNNYLNSMKNIGINYELAIQYLQELGGQNGIS